MRSRVTIFALVAAFAATAGTGAPAAAAGGAGAAPNRVSAVEVAGDGDAADVTVRVKAERASIYTVFKMADPWRIVVDVTGGDVTGVKSPVEGRGPVAGITVQQFDGDERKVGRIVVMLAEADAKYQVESRGSDIIVRVTGVSAARAAVASKLNTMPPEAAPVADAATAPPTDVVKTRTDEKPGIEKPARALHLVKLDGKDNWARLELVTDGEIAKFDVVELKEPGRLALDLHGFVVSPKDAPEGAGPIKEVRIGRHDDKVRVVVQAHAATMPVYSTLRLANGLAVTVGEPPAATAVAAAPVTPAAAAADGAVRAVRIQDVEFAAKAGVARVEIALDRRIEATVQHPDPTTAVLTLRGANLKEGLERILDVSEMQGPVALVATYEDQGEPGTVRIAATLKGPTADAIEWRKGGLRWELKGATVQVSKGPRVAGARVNPQAPPSPGGEPAASTSSGGADASPSEEKSYTGRRYDFIFKDIELQNLFTIISKLAKKNIILGDDVRGRVTLNLINVPWDQALDIVLRAKNLGKEEVGNIVRIAPMEVIRAEQKAEAESHKNRLALAPLKVRLIPVNYATASELEPKLKEVLTERGSVTLDQRTNVLIVRDVEEALARAEGLVRNLDTQTPQVLIEARIVEASTRFVRQVGIQWGGSISAAQTTGNPTGLTFPNIIVARGAADDPGASTQGTSGAPNFAVNMPAPVGVNTGAGVGFIFGSAGGQAQLNLRLTAFENNGTIRTISAPKVTTIDNKEATISQGISIPFSQVSAAGTQTSFIEARLELKVSPHVTADGSVLLNVQATNNQPNPQLTGANGQPSISRREAKTEVLVKDGDTTVIGGIYTRRNSVSWNEVPVLSRIPVLGWLFKKRSDEDDRTELLIFITPRIVNRSQSVIATATEGGAQ